MTTRDRLLPHVPWIGTSLALALLVGLLIGFPVALVVYAVLNDLGAWYYLDGADRPVSRRQAAVRLGAAVLLPVGFIVVLTSSGGAMTPSQLSGVGSSDERTRDAAIRTSDAIPPGPA